MLAGNRLKMHVCASFEISLTLVGIQWGHFDSKKKDAIEVFFKLGDLPWKNRPIAISNSSNKVNCRQIYFLGGLKWRKIKLTKKQWD